jgi:hypothetical protein
MNGVTKLGMNFAKWKIDIQMILVIMDQNHSFREDKSVEPESANDTILVLRKTECEKAKA